MIYKKIEIAVDGYKETADLYTYFLDNSIEMHINRKRPVVVICPGGGYAMTSDREAEPIAMQYLDRKSTRLNSSHGTTSRMPSSA